MFYLQTATYVQLEILKTKKKNWAEILLVIRIKIVGFKIKF